MVDKGLTNRLIKTSDEQHVHTDPNKLPEREFSRPLFKKRKSRFTSFALILLTLIVVAVALSLFVDGHEFFQHVEDLFPLISQSIST